MFVLLHAVVEVVNVAICWQLHLAVLLLSCFQLAVDLAHGQLKVFAFSSTDVEDSAFVLVFVVTNPQVAGFLDEFLSQVGVPVLLFLVELEVLILSHVFHSHDSVSVVDSQILHGSHWSWHHLFQVVHLIDMLGFSPESAWLGDED